MTEKDHYKYGLSGDKVDVEVAERLRARIRSLEAEVNEQARVNGMGGSREAAILAKVARLEAALHRLDDELTVEECDPDDCRSRCLQILDEVFHYTKTALETICAHRWYISNTATQTCYACGATQHGNGPIIPKETKAELPRCSKCGAPGGDDHGKK